MDNNIKNDEISLLETEIQNLNDDESQNTILEFYKLLPETMCEGKKPKLQI